MNSNQIAKYRSTASALSRVHVCALLARCARAFWRRGRRGRGSLRVRSIRGVAGGPRRETSAGVVTGNASPRAFSWLPPRGQASLFVMVLSRCCCLPAPPSFLISKVLAVLGPSIFLSSSGERAFPHARVRAWGRLRRILTRSRCCALCSHRRSRATSVAVSFSRAFFRRLERGPSDERVSGNSVYDYYEIAYGKEIRV